MQLPTIKVVLADARRLGFIIRIAGPKLNGMRAYKVLGHVGIYSKTGLMELLGIYG